MNRTKLFGTIATSVFAIAAIYTLQHHLWGEFVMFVIGAIITAYLYLTGE